MDTGYWGNSGDCEVEEMVYVNKEGLSQRMRQFLFL